jgi:protein-disulfide isomerase/uncharacterized membrane protein
VPLRPGWIRPAVSVLASTLGLVSATLSTLDHVGFKESGADSSGFCSAIVETGCATAHSSDASEILGVPISILGMGFYLAFIALSLAAAFGHGRGGRAGRTLSWTPAALFVVALGSIGYSAWLASVLWRSGEWCPFCVAMYAVNLTLLVVCRGWAWPGLRRPGEAIRGVFPGLALLGLVAGSLSGAFYGFYLGALPEPRVRANPDRVEPVRDPGLLALPDRVPSHGRESAPATLIEFSDLECPYCAVMHETVAQVAARLGPDRVRVRFVNFPLDTSCNCHVSVCLHKTACLAARAGICASRQGRFWEFADKAYANRQKHQHADLIGFAMDLGLDPADFMACLDSPATSAALAEDIELAARVGVKATPTVVINGVKVEGAIDADEVQEILDRSAVCSCDLSAQFCACDPAASDCACDRKVVGQPACQ